MDGPRLIDGLIRREKTRWANHAGFVFWVQRQDLNLRPSAYETDEIPGFSTLRVLIIAQVSATLDHLISSGF